MQAKTLLTTLAVSAALVAGGAFVVPVLAQGSSDKAATSAAPRLTLAQVHDKLVAAGYRSIDKIESERDRYEVKATDAEGRRVELYVDAVTAKVLKTEVKRNQRKDDRSSSDRPTEQRRN
ncbi:MAG: PepSY domain-containing protein [Rubrivivax sp.]|nr:PepSY domain-containing protein [Rubrivivax sp.]